MRIFYFTRFNYSLFLLVYTFLPLHSQTDTLKGKSRITADSIIMLEEAIVEAYQVKGSLMRIPGSIAVEHHYNLKIRDNIQPADIFNTMPGIYMQSGTYSTNRITIRGMGSRTPYNTNRIRAYFNDIPLTSSDGISTPEELDLSVLSRIEIVKGPASSLYGSGLGGSINMYLPEIQKSFTGFSVQYGSFNTYKVRFQEVLALKKAKYQFHLSHLTSDGYRQNSDYNRTLIITGAQWEGKKWTISPLLTLIAVHGGIPSSLGKTLFENTPQSAAANWLAIRGYEKYFKGIAGVTFKLNLSENLVNRFTVFGKWNNSYEKRPFNNLDDVSLSAGFRNKLSIHTSKADFIIGMEWHIENYRWQIDKDNFVQANNSETRKQSNVFAIMYYKPSSGLNISAAGALNYISYELTDKLPYNGDRSGRRDFPLIFSPRLGINYLLHTHWAVYASAGHGFSLPSPEETLLPEGDVNEKIKPETGFQFELGNRLSILKRKLDLDAAFYWIELKNLLVTKRFSEDIFMGINAGRTRHTGIEMQMNSTLLENTRFPGKIRTIAGFTHSLNKFMDFTSDSVRYDGNKLPGIPAYNLQLQMFWEPFSFIKTFLHWQYFGFQYLNDANSAHYPGYWLGNMGYTFKFKVKRKNSIEIQAGINNITDQRYASMLVINAMGTASSEPRYYYPGLPRNYFIKCVLEM